jgi:hypothetical protein
MTAANATLLPPWPRRAGSGTRFWCGRDLELNPKLRRTPIELRATDDTMHLEPVSSLKFSSKPRHPPVYLTGSTGGPGGGFAMSGHSRIARRNW